MKCYFISGYVFVLMYINIDKYLYGYFELPLLLQVYYTAAISMVIASSVCIYLWSRDKWSYHPLTQKLKYLLPGERTESTDAVAAAINTELRRPNLFNSGHYSQKVSG